METLAKRESSRRAGSLLGECMRESWVGYYPIEKDRPVA